MNQSNNLFNQVFTPALTLSSAASAAYILSLEMLNRAQQYEINDLQRAKSEPQGLNLMSCRVIEENLNYFFGMNIVVTFVKMVVMKYITFLLAFTLCSCYKAPTPIPVYAWDVTTFQVDSSNIPMFDSLYIATKTEYNPLNTQILNGNHKLIFSATSIKSNQTENLIKQVVSGINTPMRLIGQIGDTLRYGSVYATYLRRN